MAAYLEAALEEGDPVLVAAALGDIARAKGMSHVAREAGLGREPLQGAFTERQSGFATILKWCRHSDFNCTPPAASKGAA